MRSAQLGTAPSIAALVLALALGLAIGSVVGCRDATAPTDAVVQPQSQPFYYYQDSVISLVVDPTRLTLATTGPAASVAVRILAPLGVRVDSVQSIAWGQPLHWLVWLAPGTTATQAEAGAQALRRAATVRFASAAYHLAHDTASGTLELLDKVVVKLRTVADTAALDSLRRRLGVPTMTLQRDGLAYPVPEAIVELEYPRRMSVTPYAFTAYLYQQPFVEWADADALWTGRW
jgi:hypothetical protein